MMYNRLQLINGLKSIRVQHVTHLQEKIQEKLSEAEFLDAQMDEDEKKVLDGCQSIAALILNGHEMDNQIIKNKFLAESEPSDRFNEARPLMNQKKQVERILKQIEKLKVQQTEAGVRGDLEAFLESRTEMELSDSGIEKAGFTGIHLGRVSSAGM